MKKMLDVWKVMTKKEKVDFICGGFALPLLCMLAATWFLMWVIEPEKSYLITRSRSTWIVPGLCVVLGPFYIGQAWGAARYRLKLLNDRNDYSAIKNDTLYWLLNNYVSGVIKEYASDFQDSNLKFTLSGEAMVQDYVDLDVPALLQSAINSSMSSRICDVALEGDKLENVLRLLRDQLSRGDRTLDVMRHFIEAMKTTRDRTEIALAESAHLFAAEPAKLSVINGSDVSPNA